MRTSSRWLRTYLGGYAISADLVSLGQAAHEFAEVEMTGAADEIAGVIPGQPSSALGPISGFLDNRTNHLHGLASAASGAQIVSVAVGLQAAPAAGVPVFVHLPDVLKYHAQDVSGGSYVSIELGKRSGRATTNPFGETWGVMLDPGIVAKTAVNGSTGVDDFGAATNFGGYQVAHILAGNGTATIKTQHASTNVSGSFSDLAGATTGVVDCATPKALLAATARGLTVNRYIRWQIVFGTATSVTFVLSFVRGRS
jgi:hypothetical protein